MNDWESEGSDTVPRRVDVISTGSYPSPTAGTIVPPTQDVPLEPSIPNMIADAEAALSAAMRNVRAAEDWIGRAQSLLRKVREQS